jgi:predicted phosphate transport protein (TIGR00153 family)
MYGKALIPDFRGDVMVLLEGIDEIPRVFEKILYSLKVQKIVPPDKILADLSEFFLISLECCDLLIEQILAFFHQKKGIRSLLKRIDEMESKCDHYERTILSNIFDSKEIDSFEKLQLKELIQQVGEISDHADRVSKMINIFSLKRRV